MDNLVAHYSDQFKKFDGDIFYVFAKFCDVDRSPIYSWLESQFNKKTVKNNAISSHHRQKGNFFYAKKDLIKSLEFYIKSLQFAIPYSEEYGLALANRSAVLFEMGEFRHCLKDIELCFNTNYPKNLKAKIYVRRAECFVELNQMEALTKCLSEICTFLESENITDKGKFTERLNRIASKKNASTKAKNSQQTFHEIPEFHDTENKNLAYASDKVKMSYNQETGRQIIANSDVKRGDTLFIERAFVFAPVFKEDKQLHSFKCYGCLDDVMSSVPCKRCTVCAYCNEHCRDSSWNKDHKWECEGMQADIWYDLGIAFPAFRTMLQGARSGFDAPESCAEEDLKCFGDKYEGYRYFNTLVSNLDATSNVGPYVVMAATVVSYLQAYTDFFGWLLQQPKCPRKDLDGLVKYVGSRIAKHIAQLACNSSTIEHWRSSSQDLLFPDDLVTTACGIFPSVSITNHSCKPNVSNYFIRDTIIVKASEDIPLNGEVFNCYGIDYRGMKRQQRQYACRNLYNFECKCVICSDPDRELDMLNCYLCPQCKGPIPETNKLSSFCMKCREKFNLHTFRKINNEAGKCLNITDNSSRQLEVLMKTLKVKENILYKYHEDFEDLYYIIYSFYVEQGDAENMFKYFHLWLENVKTRRGGSARDIGTNLYEAALAILHCLQNGQQKANSNLKDFLQKVEWMIKEAKVILNLYYPAYVTSRLNEK